MKTAARTTGDVVGLGTEDIQRALRDAGWAGVVSRLRVCVHDGVLSVSGYVSSYYQKQVVRQEIMRIAGALRVEDQLAVILP